MLPRLLVWTTIGLLAYGTAEAGASTYHFMRDARVTPLAAAHIRAELHALMDEAMRRQPAQPAVPHEDMSEGHEGQTLAFVPHTHVPNIKANATLYDCRLLGMFDCQPVGRVLEVLPGEVAETNIAGIEARGQYALMQLTDPSAAEAESLSVRDPLVLEGTPQNPQAPQTQTDAETSTAAAQTLL